MQNIIYFRTCNGKVKQHGPDLTARYRIPLPEGYKSPVLCAGSLTLGRSGLCEGDSGSPVMLPELNSDGSQTTWVMFGLVSGGIPEYCGSRDHPTRFLRLDDKDINNYILKTIEEFEVSEGKTIEEFKASEGKVD